MTAITDKLGVNSWGMYFDPAKFDFETFKSHWDYDLSMMNKLPINWVRIGYTYYDGAVNADGSMNFERLDYAIESAQKYGFKVILPIWVVYDGLTNKTNIDYQSYYAKWLEMIRAIVMRYAGKGIYYEAVDEALSGGHFWLNQSISDSMVADIVNMNDRFYAYTKAYDPTAKFISGDFASPSSTAYQAIENGILDYGDFASYHPYFTNPENMISSSDQVAFRQAIKDRGLKLSATEYGFGVPSAFNGANTREEQASKLVRQTLILDMLGFEHIIQFTMDGSDKAWVMQNEDGTFNLTGNTMQNVMFSLQGYSFSERIESDENDYIFRYLKDGDVDKIVYWTIGTEHYNGSYYLTQTPKIVELDGATNNSENKYDSIKLTRLSSLEILNNFQGNLGIILGAFEEVNSFLETYGFEYSSESFDTLEQYDQLDRNFLFALQTEIEKIDQTINQYIAIFENTSWLEGGHYDNYPGHSLFDTGYFQYTLNQYWNKFESNMNILLGIIDTL
ncbi:beta-galactosidase [Leuconostoc gelidum]|uniref:beta-galactosidase n=1 Tax=Leuconostoc gelidum TaxID=1244 RepID=UPI001CC59261|nr:beta-galactosidase [Leuconostoc gelidum]MBZ6000963.1 beta-galactosidase [Leuconostoc gelidum subsp. gelidum]